MAAENIRVLVPRVRRAVEGVGQPEVLTEDQVKDLVADAIAEVILYTGGLFGHDLIVAERDATTNAPTEYETSEPLTLAEGSVVAAQAALDYIFVGLQSMKASETIRDEGQEWSWTTSSTLVRDRVAALQAARDQALAQINAAMPVSFVSFLHERDRGIAEIVEPFYLGP